MTEVIVFPDAAAIVIGYLTAQLPTVTVGTKLPSPITGTFVRVFRTGGLISERVVDQAQLTVETYADANERGPWQCHLPPSRQPFSWER